ncbi:MAG: PKD domain-containing protein, partial [Owenweeksia sp.]
PVYSPAPCNLITLSPINYHVDIHAEVVNTNGKPLSNYAVYVGGGSGQGGKPLKKLITGANGKVHDSLIPGNTPSLYAYVYDCYLNKVLDFEVAMIGTESDSTSFKFILNCPADTCDIALSHRLVDADSGIYEFKYESVGQSVQVITPLWSFSDGSMENGTVSIQRPVEPGNFTYCIDLGCSAKTCNSFYADPNCTAEFFLDTVNSIVFNGNIIFWKNVKLGSHYSYTWDFGDGMTSNRAYPVHSYTSPGSYQICLTVHYDDGITSCSNTYCETVVFEKNHLTFQIMDPATIGMGEFIVQEIEYSLFPNPASDEVRITWDKDDTMEKIMLYQANGQLIRSWKGGTEGEQIIRLEEIPAGTYIVKII